MHDEVLEAKAAAEQRKKDLEEQKSKWPAVHWIAKALNDALEENHFSERLRRAQEGHSDRL